jgi:hypothetical protein
MFMGYVEATARERWTDSAFVTATVRQAIDLLLRHWGAHEPPAIPAAIKELATRLPTDYASMRHDPAKVALEIGTAEAGRLIAQIESRGVFEGEDDPLNLPPSPKIHVPDKWREHRRILRGLGSGWKRRELREQGKKMLG